ncbi:glycosyltransferase family 4 protein [Streptosporangium sp. NPDC002524]|uniref:glycosyltransferase family 4 protein n=1 Tax=Streptosporangium sp. NPDC002524 TaxID=3154537 RepID=UPI0033271B12
MRILRIGYRLPPEPGGKERHIERLSREQILRGHEVHVAHRLGETPEGARTVPLAPTRVSRALSWRSDVVAFGAECARALPRVGRVDVVHLHGDHREALALGAAARRLGVPLVLTVHGALTARHRAVMPRAFRHVDGFIALGDRPAEDLVAAGIPAGRIRTMSSGLDLAHLSGFRRRGPAEPGLVVSVGALEKVKDHAVTIRAFRELRATCPGSRLVIVGEGSERARLERLAGPGSGVEFAGRLPADEVYALVGTAQAFVLSSRRLRTLGEGIPTAALEALALGTPVIVASDASLDPVIADRAAYRTFPSGSVADLLRHLRVVLHDETAGPRMAERGRRAVSALDWPLVAARVEEWYETFARAGTPPLSRSAS